MTQPSNKSRLILIAGVLALVLGVIAWRLVAGTTSETATADASEPGTAALAKADARERAPRLDLSRETKAAISGTVRVRGGGPIAGALVCASANQSALFGLGDGLPVCSTSGNDGRYRIEGLWPVETYVDAGAAGHQPSRWKDPSKRGFASMRISLHPGEQRQGIDIELLPGGTKITGVVKDISGGEIEGAFVNSAGGFGDSQAFARSDENGRFELWTRPGALELEAVAEGYTSSSTYVHSPTERAELYLTPESVLIGRVVDAQTGEPVADVTVTANGNRMMGRRLGPESTRSDADGNFSIRGLQPGVYKPTGRADHFYGQAEMQVHLGLGQTSEPVEIRVHRVSLVEGHILAAGSELGSDAGCDSGSVRLTEVGGRESVNARSDDEGHVVLRGVLPGVYEVSVSCADMVSEPEYPNITVIAGEDVTDVIWEVREGQAIRGVVVDAEGAAVPDVQIRANMKTDPNDPRGQTTNSWSGASEADGSFELAGLLPGTYQLNTRGELPSEQTPLEVELAPGADRNDVRIELPANGTVRGRVIDERGVGQPNVQVVAGLFGRWPESQTRTDDQGNFVLEHVRTGEVRVKATSDGWGQGLRRPGSSDDDEQGELVTVAANTEIDVELVVESRDGVIRGQVLDESGAPVDDAFVSAQRISERAGANGTRERSRARWGVNTEPRLSDADGNFTIDGLAPGRYMVHANRKGGGEALAEDVALGSNVVLTITSTGVLGGVVLVDGGAPPSRFDVSVRDDKAGLFFRDSFFRTDGRWQISELPAGSYEIAISSAQGDGKLDAVLEEGGAIVDLELTLESHVTVTGRLIDADTGAPVPGMQVSVGSRASGMFGGRGAKPGNEISDEQGRFEVENATTGKVRIMVLPRNFSADGDYGWTAVGRTLPPEPAVQDVGDISLFAKRTKSDETPGDLGYETAQPMAGDELEDRRHEIALVRPGGPAEAAGLKVGDVIEQVDGHSVVGENANYYFNLVAAPAGTVLTLTLADGKTVKLTLGPPRK